MWFFDQLTGNIWHDDRLVGGGYSGYAQGKNNPDMQDVHEFGPIPRGTYFIGDPVDGTHMGEFAIPLTPAPTNVMFDRLGFFWHGDDKANPGAASRGCLISSRWLREEAIRSGDLVLEVRTGTPDGVISRVFEYQPGDPLTEKPQARMKA